MIKTCNRLIATIHPEWCHNGRRLWKFGRSCLRTHEHFDGVSLAPDGKQLNLDYYGYPEPCAQRFFHYVISLDSSPKLLSGHTPISVDAEQELAYEDIPRDVIHDACEWLRSNANIAHTSKKESLTATLLEYLDLLDRQRSEPDPRRPSTQQTFNW